MQTIVSREAIVEAYEQGVEAVVGLFDQVLEQLVALEARVKELERRRAVDSHNSSKPPSSDPPGGKPSPKSLRKPSGKRSGGQPGHRGATLPRSPHPDRTVLHSPDRCGGCGVSLAEAPVVGIERRQVIELPAVGVEVVEHQAESRRCRCGQITRGDFPREVTANIQYGPRVRALAVYLNQGQLLPMERTVEILSDVFGCESFSEGTLANAVEQCYEGLAEIEAAIKTAVQAARVAHFDETGLEVGGKLHWLHVAATASLTHYGWAPRRGPAGADAIGVLPKFKGIGVHDGLETYWGYRWEHALCNGHHLRELTFVEEQFGQAWAKDLQALLRQMRQAVAEARAGGQVSVATELEQSFATRYGRILAEGFRANPPPARAPGARGRPKRGRVLSLLDRLSNHREAVLRFLHDFAVPFDNNQAERDLRMMKVKQKISGCFRTSRGANMFCRIRTYISTVHKQGAQILACLLSVVQGSPFMPAIAAE